MRQKTCPRLPDDRPQVPVSQGSILRTSEKTGDIDETAKAADGNDRSPGTLNPDPARPTTRKCHVPRRFGYSRSTTHCSANPRLDTMTTLNRFDLEYCADVLFADTVRRGQFASALPKGE